MISSISNTSNLDKITIDLNIDKEDLMSDAFDISMSDDPLPSDRDELTLGAYKSTNKKTRGDASKITLFLGKGKSITVRLSKSLVDSIIKAQLNTSYMRYKVKLGDAKPTYKTISYDSTTGEVTYGPPYYPGADQLKRKITWRLDTYVGNPFGTFQGHALTLEPDNNRANMHGCKVTNLRTKEVQAFSTDEKGKAHWGSPYASSKTANPLYDVIPFSKGLAKGDTLEFYGHYKFEKSTKIFFPTLKLADGHFEVSGNVERDGFCYDDINIDFSGKLTVSIDPATGKVEFKAKDVAYDLPWYEDACIAFAKFGASIVTGPFAGIIRGILQKVLAEVDEQGSKFKLLPTISDSKYIQLFWEQLTIKKNGLILHGQLEAGWLHGGGRREDTDLEIDSLSKIKQYLYVSEKYGEAGLSSYSDGKYETEWKSRITLVKNKTFEQLGAEDIKSLTDNATNQSVKLPKLEGSVLAIRTLRDHYAKARIDRSKKNTYVLRWISYNIPKPPSVQITGAWKSDLKTTKSSKLIWYDIHKYSGKFSFKLHRLCTGAPLKKIEWKFIEGEGTKQAASFSTSADKKTVEVVVDADKLPKNQQSFISKLTLTVEDIFGRVCSDDLPLNGSKSYGVPGPGLFMARHPDDWLKGYKGGLAPITFPWDDIKIWEKIAGTKTLPPSEIEDLEAVLKEDFISSHLGRLQIQDFEIKRQEILEDFVDIDHD